MTDDADASDEKHEWSVVRDHATKENGRCARWSIGASTKRDR